MDKWKNGVLKMGTLTCSCGLLEEIHGFKTPGEFDRFKIYLAEQLSKDTIKKTITDQSYKKGMIFGGEWFICNTCNEIWRLVPPDYPFRGLWEKVDR
jgi:hypothetical protein